MSVLGLLRSGRVDPGRRGVLALVAVGLLAAVVAGVVLLRVRPSEQPLVAPAVAGAGSAPRPDVGSRGVLVVDVTGRVRHPGIVRLPDGSRVDDALKTAGGLLPGASTGLLNLAQKVMDGQQVVVGGPAGHRRRERDSGRERPHRGTAGPQRSDGQRSRQAPRRRTGAGTAHPGLVDRARPLRQRGPAP